MLGKEKKTEFCIIGLDSFKGNLKYNQCKEIRRIIKLGKAPDIKILAYDLQSVVGDRESTVLWSAYSKTHSVSNVM